MKRYFPLVALPLFFSVMHSAQASCGSAYCLVNTSWNGMNLLTEPGWRLDTRYEYINQDELRNGTGSGHPSREEGEHDEVRTVNRNLQTTLDYASGKGWGVSVSVPVVSRNHDHVHNEDTGPESENWDFTELGDVKVLGRLQLSALEQHKQAYGVLGGVKLPTGHFDVDNSAGEEAERTLQPGTGTTDMLLGAFYTVQVPEWHSSWFVQGLAQRALDSRNHFKPGESFGLDLGYRYSATERLGLQLQVNYQHKWRDSGYEAEPDDSGSNIVSLSPGASYSITPKVDLYSFVQLPVYRDFNGTQLSSDRALIAGLTVRF
ncbi:MAG TPA: transporter [Pseudomonadales bacterium]|nr:transporter [Pseudomonadales bacterium]